MLDEFLANEFRGSKFLIIPGHYDYFGGAERQATILAESLVNDYGCQVDFLGWGGNGVLADAVRAIGCKPWVFPLDQNRRAIPMAFDLIRLTRLIRHEIKPQYLLPFVGFHCKVIGKIWKYTGARFTWWNQRDEGRLVFGTKTEHRLIKSLPAIVSNSFEGREFLVSKFGLAPEQVRVINNGIKVPQSMERRGLWRTECGFRNEDIVFTMVANHSQYKDHQTLMKAFSMVSQKLDQHCHLVLAGRYDEMTQPLKAMAFDLGLCGKVHFPGVLDGDSLHQLLVDSDLLVHSSTTEGCPNAVLEAMARGLCVVGTDISGMRQSLGDALASECMAPPANATALAEKMLNLASNSERRAALGQQNLERIRNNFSVEKMVYEVLDTVLQFRVT